MLNNLIGEMNMDDTQTKKRDITSLIEKEAPNLNNLLDPEDVTKFKELTGELRDTWTKKQMFRTQTEMEFSVLNDAKYPTKAAKYWQCVREQNVFLENLMNLSFDYRKNEVETKQLEKKRDEEKDELENQILQKLFTGGSKPSNSKMEFSKNLNSCEKINGFWS